MTAIRAWMILGEKYIPSQNRWSQYSSIHALEGLASLRVEQLNKSKNYRNIRVTPLVEKEQRQERVITVEMLQKKEVKWQDKMRAALAEGNGREFHHADGRLVSLICIREFLEGERDEI